MDDSSKVDCFVIMLNSVLREYHNTQHAGLDMMDTKKRREGEEGGDAREQKADITHTPSL
jgi:hypothetical protein